jgi:hypothetical protein
MAIESESEIRGINCLGNPEIEFRSADGGKTGENPIGGRLPSGIMARGTAASIRSGRMGMADGKESLRKASNR